MKSLFIILFTFLIFPAEEWKLAKEKNGIKVYTRMKEGQRYKEFRAMATFKTTKERMVSEFVNLSTMNQWYDMIEKVELLKKISESEAIYKLYFDFPSPTTNRYAVVKAGLTKDAKNGNITVYSKAIDYTHKAEPDRIRILVMESKWYISGNDNALTIDHTGYLDPEGSIPLWMFNSGLSDGPYRTLTNIKARVEK